MNDETTLTGILASDDPVTVALLRSPACEHSACDDYRELGELAWDECNEPPDTNPSDLE